MGRRETNPPSYAALDQRRRRAVHLRLFGPNYALKEWRKDHGLTQKDAAELFGVTQPTVSNWERGTDPTSRNVLDYIKEI